MLDEQTRYRLLRLLQDNPELSQREIAEQAGVSLGKVNYCLNALIEKGLVKIQNFKNSRKKRAYLYKLTPAGIQEKTRVTRRFLARKMKEHEAMAEEIERLKHEVRQ